MDNEEDIKRKIEDIKDRLSDAERVGGKHLPTIGGDESYVNSKNHSAQWIPHGLETPIKSDSITVNTNHSRNRGVVTFSLMTDVPKAKQDPSRSPTDYQNTTRYSLGHGIIYPDGSIDLTPFPSWTHDTRGHVDKEAIKFILRDHLDSKVKHPKTGEITTVGEYHGLKSPIQEDLRRWFKEKWTAQDGSECGDYKGSGRVKCRPSRRVSKKSPQTWSEMSKEEKQKAVSKKQEAHREGKQFSSHKTGKTWDGPKNKYKPEKKNIKEDTQQSGESYDEYRTRLLRQIKAGEISSFDNHDRIHGALVYLDSIQPEYNRGLDLIVRTMGRSTGGHASGLKVTGLHPSGKFLTGYPTGAGGKSSRHRSEVTGRDNPVAKSSLHLSHYSFLEPEHRRTLQRIMNLREGYMRELIEKYIKRKKDCGCNQLSEEKEKKPYKGFKKGKNHPEGGLSRAEAKRQGIHAGVETKDEAEKKGGFGKLSKKTQSRRKSFCARMCGMKKRRTSSKTANDPKSKINAALRVWGCRCGTNESYEPNINMIMESKNKPTNSKLWSQAKAMAKKKFDVYPSAYANAWAAKWYKKKGGGWSVNEDYIAEEIVNPENAGTMTDEEKRAVDRLAPKLKNVKVVKKGDTLKKARYRYAVYLILQRRKSKGKKKEKKGKK